MQSKHDRDSRRDTPMEFGFLCEGKHHNVKIVEPVIEPVVDAIWNRDL